MAERRSLTAGLSIVPPDADPEAVQAFLKQDTNPAEAKKPPVDAPAKNGNGPDEPVRMERKSRVPARGRSVIPVGLIPVTVRLRPEIASALKRASLERQLQGEEPSTQQEIVQEALEPWLRGRGFLA